jgi:hypothetical protein
MPGDRRDDVQFPAGVDRRPRAPVVDAARNERHEHGRARKPGPTVNGVPPRPAGPGADGRTTRRARTGINGRGADGNESRGSAVDEITSIGGAWDDPGE